MGENMREGIAAAASTVRGIALRDPLHGWIVGREAACVLHANLGTCFLPCKYGSSV